MLRVCMVVARGHVTESPLFGRLDTGGSTLYAVRLARALADVGAAVDIVTPRLAAEWGEEEAIDDRVRVIRLACNGPEEVGERWCMMPSLVERVLARDSRYDLVVSHCYDGGLAGLMLARELGVQHVHIPHTLGAFEPDGELGERLRIEDQVLANADAVIVPSERIRRDLAREYSIVRSCIHVVPPAVEGVKVRAGKPLKNGAVVAVTRCSEPRGLDVLVDALDLLQSTTQFHLYVAGTALLEDEHGRVVRDEIVDRGLAPRVTVLGALPTPLIPTLCGAAQVFVNPSRYHAYGLAAVEAMARGTPPIVSTGAGAFEVVSDGETGLVVSPGDPVRLADGLALLLHNPDLAAKLGRQARAAPAARRSWRDVVARLLQIAAEQLVKVA